MSGMYLGMGLGGGFPLYAALREQEGAPSARAAGCAVALGAVFGAAFGFLTGAMYPVTLPIAWFAASGGSLVGIRNKWNHVDTSNSN